MASNTELYLSKLLGENVETPRPFSRIELQLARLLGENVDCPAPQSRVEQLLERLNESGLSGSGGSSGASSVPWYEDLKVSDASLSGVEKIAYGNGMWVAALGYDGLSYSTDGLAWTDAEVTYRADGTSHNEVICIYDVTYNNGVWVASGCVIIYYEEYYGEQYGFVLISADGKTWDTGQVLASVPYSSCDTLFYNNGVWHTSIYPGDSLAYSTDGVVWSSCSGLTYYDGGGTVEYHDGKWFCATDNSLCVSNNGITWTTIYTTGEYANVQVAYGDDRLVFTNESNYEMKWVDYTNVLRWADVEGVTVNMGGYLIYVNGLWLYSRLEDGIFYSSDGKTWNRAMTYPEYGDGWLYYTYKLTIASVNNPSSSETEYYAFTYGYTWEKLEIDAIVNYLQFVNGLYIGLQNRMLVYSYDGKTWNTVIDRLLGNRIGYAPGDKSTLIYGNNGTILIANTIIPAK